MTRIYIASKVRHAPRWREYRDRGSPIISTWIDEAEEGQTASYAELWKRIYAEVASATKLVLWAEERGDNHHGHPPPPPAGNVVVASIVQVVAA